MEAVETPTPNRFKNFVSRHRVSIAVAVTAGVCVTLNQLIIREHNEFLKEKGLYDEFYETEEE